MKKWLLAFMVIPIVFILTSCSACVPIDTDNDNDTDAGFSFVEFIS